MLHVGAHLLMLKHLLELIITEQFKTSVPEQIAMYVNEHKVQSPDEAASLADDFVLTYRSTPSVLRTWEGASIAHFANTTPQFGHISPSKFDSANTYNYCRGKGHWKADGLVFKINLLR